MPEGFKIADGYVDIEVDQAALDQSIAAVEAKLAAIRARAIEVGINQATVDKGIAVVQAKLNALRGRIGVEINEPELMQAIAEIDGMMKAMQKRWNVHIELDPGALTGLMALNQQANSLEEHIAAARNAMAELAAVSFTGVGQGGGVFGRWGAWFHWIIAGGAELLSVVIPATIALGSAALVAAEGFGYVQQHMAATYTAAEATHNMLHQTIGAVLGLGDALQRAQTAANPMVYQALGGALEIAKSSFNTFGNTGLQVLQEIDTFIAKIQLDLQTGLGSQLHGLVSRMVPDLTQLAQIFGNIGHAIVNFAGAMPGLAQLLLTVADAISRVILWISQLPSWIITTFMVLEELYRWGGLAVTIFARLGAAIASLGTLGVPLIASFGQRFASVITVIGESIGGFLLNLGTTIEKMGSVEEGAGRLASGAARAGSGIAETGVKIGSFIEAVPVWQAALVALAVGGFAFLAYKALSAKTATQEWVDSMNQALAKTSDLQLMNAIQKDMIETSTRLAQAQAQVNKMQTDGQAVASGVASRYQGLSDQFLAAQGRVATLSQQMQNLTQQIRNVDAGTSYLINTYHTSYIGALALAQAANVSLTTNLRQQTQASEIARLKIIDLIAGYRAMGQPIGAIGNDMTALAIQAGLQSTRVSQLNSAWDQFMQTLTSGTNSLATFETSLTNITGVAASTGLPNLGRFSGATLAIQNFAKALSQGPASAATAWQNFDQIVGNTAPQLTDFLRTAGTEGAVSSQQFTQAIGTMIAQMLPFASKSRTATAELSALAQEAGGPATDSFQVLKAWVEKTHPSVSALSDIINGATIKMSNMGEVASKLGNVLNSDIIATMDGAKIAASGLSGATEKYTRDLMNQNTPAKTLATDQNNLKSILTQLTGSATTANGIIQTYGKSLDTTSGQSETLKKRTEELRQELLKLQGNYTAHIFVTQTGAIPNLPGGQGAHAATGRKIPGYGGGDIVPILAEPGETVISKEHTAMLTPLFKAIGVPGFAGGGPIGFGSALELDLAQLVSSASRGGPSRGAGTVTSSTAGGGGRPTVIQQFYGPQYPDSVQRKMMNRQAALDLGLAP